MKMKRFFLGAFGLLALASCSNDELTSVNRDGDEIAFNVVTNSVSRAADVYCNNNLPEKFKVWAQHANKPYIDGDVITKGGTEASPTWVNSSGTRYWPDEGEVSFFASYNEGVTATNTLTWSNNIPSLTFEVNDAVADQKDFIYAAKKQSKITDAAGKVLLNFRHALSQIVFQAKNTNPNLYVKISGVSVCNAKSKGIFTYPTSNTDDNIEDVDHNGDFGNTISYDNSWGSWGTLSDVIDRYDVSFESAIGISGSKDATAVSLTNNGTDEEFNTNAMLLIPQETHALDVTKSITDAYNADRTYFRVKCQIYNVAGDTYEEGKDVCLWGKDGAADVAIPVDLTWKQSKKYIYTFVFGDGNGGYNPDPNKPKPDPVLVPITFNVTIDDFVTEANEDIEMKEPEANSTEG